jgi:hypothetical protein
MFHRNDDAEPRPGIFARMQYRVSGWFAPRPQPQMTASVSTQGGCQSGACGRTPYVTIATGEPPAGGMTLPPYSGPTQGGFGTIEQPTGRPHVSFGNSEPPVSEPTTVPASFNSEPAPVATEPSTLTVNRVAMDPSIKIAVDPSIPAAGHTGHETDYSWVTGRVNFVHGGWVIEYDGPGSDQFSGKLRLANVDAGSLHDGDFVCVTGALTLSSSGQVSGDYRVSSISLFERAR